MILFLFLFFKIIPFRKLLPFFCLFLGSPAAFEKPSMWKMAEVSHQGSDLPLAPEGHSWGPCMSTVAHLQHFLSTYYVPGMEMGFSKTFLAFVFTTALGGRNAKARFTGEATCLVCCRREMFSPVQGIPQPLSHRADCPRSQEREQTHRGRSPGQGHTASH